MIRFGLTPLLVLSCLLVGFPASAQAPAPPADSDPAPPASEGEPAPDAVEAAVEPPVEAASPAADSTARMDSELAALKAALADTKAQVEALAARLDDAEAAVPDETPQQDLLRIYGFADMGVQRLWSDKASLISRVFAANSTTFVIGNVNLYVDAQPIEDWRALVEVRFTNAPLGDTLTYGGIAGTFARKGTFSYDPHGTAINAPMWAGAVVLERAWIEWNSHQAFKLRIGNWFTPFGIWNADHGSPTLIAMALPQFITQLWMPMRQTGLMGYGNAFAGEWELGYALTFSNGRQEISNFNFENKFGYGGRLYARRDTGAVNTTFGLSYFTGTSSDEVIDVTSLTPITFEKKKTWEYNEHVLGADASIDIDATRIRAEAILRRVTYTPGRREPGDPIAASGSVKPDAWQQSAYLLVANQLPWAGIEPFLWTELMTSPSSVGDGIFVASLGVNVHFNAAITWKTQFTRAHFFEWLYDSTTDPSINDASAAYSRIVVAF
ncbi:MAG: hypothetical protein ABI895_20925 [Deltaproteobacteria bacterium]